MDSTNSGIHVSGSATVNAGAMAAGDHATATNQVTHGADAEVLADLRRNLADLAEQIRARADELDDPESAAAMARLAQTEAAKDKPNHTSLLGLLQALGATVGSVAALGGSVTSIIATVSALAGG